MDPELHQLMMSDHWTKIAFQWMADNQPEVLRDLSPENLADALVDKVQQARELQASLIQKKVEPRAAEEQAIAILAPPPEQEPAESLTMDESESKRIWEDLKSLSGAT
jgi:hypothetical protein